MITTTDLWTYWLNNWSTDSWTWQTPKKIAVTSQLADGPTRQRQLADV